MNLKNISLLLLLIIISSCSVVSHNSGYDANPVFAPLPDKASEIKVNVGYGRILGIHSNASYSLSNHLAILAGGVYNHQNIRTIEAGFFSSQFFRLRSHYFEGALGYFKPIKQSSFTKFEVFAGFGKGITNKKFGFNKDFSGSYHAVTGTYSKVFLQTSAKVLGTAPHLDLTFANRISYLYFYNLNFYDLYNGQKEADNFDKAKSVLMEPVMIINSGKKLKATGQVGLAFPIAGGRLKNYRSSYSTASAIFQVGLQYQIK